MRVIAYWANKRSQWLRLPYGDQALFMRKDTFREAGGFPEMPIMEDYALVRRLARKGKIRIAHLSAETSGRRWQSIGPWRTMLYNQLIVAGYHLGVAPERLALFYGRRHV